MILYNSEMATQVALDAIQILGKMQLHVHIVSSDIILICVFNHPMEHCSIKLKTSIVCVDCVYEHYFQSIGSYSHHPTRNIDNLRYQFFTN